MAAIETQVANSYESTLSASLDAGDTTTHVTATDSTPGTPFYVVIDPGDDEKREVVLVDDGKTGTTLTLSSSAQRGLDGTTDVDHDANAVIGIYPIAAHWKDINDRVDQHAHGGGTDGAAVATSSLSGHDKAAHDALGIDADTVDGSHAAALLDRANHTGTQTTSTLSDHDKATHDALGLDHGSLSGLADFTADHGTEHEAVDHTAVVGGVVSSAWEPGSRSSIPTSEGSFTTHSGTFTLADPGYAVDVFVALPLRSSKGPGVGVTDIDGRVRISLDGGSTWTSTETTDFIVSADTNTGHGTIMASASGTPTGQIQVELASQRQDAQSGAVAFGPATEGRVDIVRTS